jgi:hypothetical protein
LQRDKKDGVMFQVCIVGYSASCECGGSRGSGVKIRGGKQDKVEGGGNIGRKEQKNKGEKGK